MKGNTSAHSSHRQLLMRCRVTNRHGQASERFIDHSEFPLWRFLMEERHGLKVEELTPCVWVPEEERRRHDRLFAHAAYHEPVQRLVFEKFDAHTGVTETQTRFVPTCDMETVTPVLEGHLAADTAAVVLDIQAGEAISTAPAKRWLKARPAAAYYAA